MFREVLRSSERTLTGFGPYATMASMTTTARTSVPPEPGTARIPYGHVRLFHSTGADPETVRRQGLRLSNARGSTHGEPDVIWFQAGAPYNSVRLAHTVEVSLPVSEEALSLAGGNFKQKLVPSELEGRRAHMWLNRDLRPDEIMFVHEPWHFTYRYLEENYNDPRHRDSIVETVEMGHVGEDQTDRAMDEFARNHGLKVG